MAHSCASLVARLYSDVSSEERSHISAQIDGILKDQTAAERILTEIAAATGNQLVLFGLLSVLDQWVSRHMSSLSMVTQVHVREGVMRALVSHEHSKQVLVKYSKIIASIAIHQYPGIWPSFIADVTSMWAEGGEQLVFAALHLLTSVFQDCIDSDFTAAMTAARRQEVLNSLLKELPPLLDFAYEWMARCHSQQGNSSIVALTKDAIAMHVPLVSIVKPAQLCRPPHDLNALLMSLLQSEAYFTSTLPLLHAIAHCILDRTLFIALASTLPRLTYPKHPDQSQHLEAQILLSDSVHGLLVEALGADYMTQRVGEGTVLSPELVLPTTELLRFAVALLQIPSRRLALSALGYWLRMLKHEALYLLPGAESLLIQTLGVVFERGARVRWIEDDGGEEGMEFEDKDEYIDAHNLLRGKGGEVAKLIAIRYPSASLALVSTSLRRQVQMYPSATDYLVDGLGTVNTTAYLQWECAGYALSVVCRELLPPLPASLQTVVHELTEGVLTVPAPDPLLLLEKINWLEDLSGIVTSKAHLQAVLSHALSLSLPSEVPGYEVVAGRACASISTMVARCTGQLLQHHLVVWTCEAIQTAMGNASPSQHTSLTEALLVLSERIASLPERVQVLLSALRSRVDAWTSEHTRAIFATPHAFLASCMAVDFPISAIRANLSSLLAIAKKIPIDRAASDATCMQELAAVFPFALVWDALLDPTVHALQCLHSLYEPAFRVAIVSVQPTANIYTHPSLLSEVDETVRTASHRVEAILLLLYQLLGQAGCHRALYLHSSHAALGDVIRYSVAYLDNSVVTRLLKLFIEPYIIHAPPAVYALVSIPLSAVLCNTHTRLLIASTSSGTTPSTQRSQEERFYEYIYAQCGIATSRGEVEQRSEVLRADMLFGLTRALVDTYSVFYGLRGPLAVAAMSRTDAGEVGRVGRGKGGSKVEAREEDSDFHMGEELKKSRLASIDVLFSTNKGLSEALLASAVVMVALPDAYTSRKTVKLMEVLMERAMASEALVALYCGDLWREALYLLLRQEAWAVGMEGDLLAFLQTVYCASVLPDPPLTPPSLAPRLSLLGLPHVTPSDVSNLEAKLRSDKGGKRRRELLKDFLRGVMTASGADSAAGGLFSARSKEDNTYQRERHLERRRVAESKRAQTVLPQDLHVLFA